MSQHYNSCCSVKQVMHQSIPAAPSHQIRQIRCIMGNVEVVYTNKSSKLSVLIIFSRASSRSQHMEPTDNERAELKADDVEEEVKFSSDDKKKEKRPSLPRIIVGQFRSSFLLAIFFKLLNDCIMFVQPQLLRFVYSFFY